MKIYAVGGCVRDELLGVPCNDRDYVVVGATPWLMETLGFSQVGASFPVFLHPVTKEEYALARTERKIGLGYLGFEVDASVEVTLEEDLARRDLTMNSIAKDLETGEFIDPFNGMQDMRDRVLRHTSDAFSEDPLRVIRLARFAARYPDFNIAPTTLDLCKKIVASNEMNSLSSERMWEELSKNFAGAKDAPRFFTVLSVVGALNDVVFFKNLIAPNARVAACALEVAHLCEKENLDADVAVMLFSALVSAPSSATILMTGSSRLRALHAAWNHNTVTDFLLYENTNATTAYNALKLMGAWREGTLFDDVCLTMGLEESMGGKFNVNVGDMELAVDDAAFVRAFHFPDLTGRDLGAAIDKKRIEVISHVLNLKN